MYRKFLFFFLLCLHSLCLAKPPSLTPKDTKNKIEEILRAHACYQQLDTEIVRRSLQNYIDEIDPLKTYFIETEVVKWTSPSDKLLDQVLLEIQSADFSTFLSIHESFLGTLSRRDELERGLTDYHVLPKDVSSSEFKNAAWTVDKDELKNRLLRIKALQIEAADKLSSADKNQFLQKLSKRRLNREGDLKGKSEEERKQISLAFTLKAISSALDSQTAYFTPTEATSFMMQIQQKLYGIGAQLRDDLNGLTVIRLIEGGPAAISGLLHIGDRIISVNEEPILGMDITEAVDLIRGKQGTPVSLTIIRPNESHPDKEETLDIKIVREEVVLQESRLNSSTFPFGDGVIGVFHLFSFYEDKKNSSSLDLAKAIDEVKKTDNLKGIILDLRNNAGGLLSQAIDVTGLFISKGIVVSVKSNSGEIEHLRNLSNKKIWDGPLLVLTNKASASASEIVAQTLQDYGRALVVGDSETFGKGTFQTFTLESTNYGKVNPKGEFKVTRGRYYTVSGKSPQFVGVKADIVVPGALSQLELGEKYAKFPLSSDEIGSGFEDDLSDVSPLLRKQISRLYTNRQELMTTYVPYLETLKKNSEGRIANSKSYQIFLEEINKKEEPMDLSDFFGTDDLQLTETIHVMSDLIYLSQGKD